MNKKLFLFFLIILATVFILKEVKGESKSYYFGDAINYNSRIIFGTVNSDDFELFALIDNKIIKTAEIKAIKNTFLGEDNFSDLQFKIKDGKLYLYLTKGRFLYKYDISNIYNPKLEKQVKNNIWDWFNGLTMENDRIVTIGIKGLKVWNDDLQIINGYDLKNEYQYDIKFSKNGRYIFNSGDNIINIFDTYLRKIIAELPMTVNQYHFRKVYNDSLHNAVYAVDDESLKKFNFSGQSEVLKSVKEFKHISTSGYDVDGLDASEFVYFSDGIGIVKADKINLEPIDWVYTTDLGAKGGWAQGLKIIDGYDGEVVIAFNTSCILVLDNKLDLIDYYKIIEKDEESQEDLWLSLDKDRATAGSLISLRGGGYGLKEKIVITFAGEEYIAQADDKGRFTAIVTVPSVLSARTDIKVSGQYSGLNYSIAFNIE